MKKIRAVKVGFDNIKVRVKGELFDWPHDEIPSWAEEVESSSEDLAEERKVSKKSKAETSKSQPVKSSGDEDVI